MIKTIFRFKSSREIILSTSSPDRIQPATAVRVQQQLKAEGAFAFDINQDVTCFVCHQANINILREIGNRTGIPEDKFFVNLHRYGNTASASVPIALDEAVSNGTVKKGDLVVTAAFGGGLSWGANLIRM